jgi:hypothetical protein
MPVNHALTHDRSGKSRMQHGRQPHACTDTNKPRAQFPLSSHEEQGSRIPAATFTGVVAFDWQHHRGR